MSSIKFDYPNGRAHPASKWPTAVANNVVFQEYFYRLKNLCINVYEWKNLPKFIDERFMEMTLFDTGMAVFFYDEILEDYLCMTTMIGGPLDVYRIPKYRRAYATNGYQRTLSDRDSVLVFNNYLHIPSFSQVDIYAHRLYEIERTIDVNVKQQKFPLIIRTSEGQRLTMKNLYMQIDGNEPVIYGDKNMNMEGMEVLNTNAPYVADKLMDLKHQVWNEALTYFGIENSNTDKRERLLSDEVISNMGAVDAQRFVGLNARRQACEQINDMFGLDIWVDYRSDFSTMTRDGKTTAPGDQADVSRETFQEGADDE